MRRRAAPLCHYQQQGVVTSIGMPPCKCTRARPSDVPPLRPLRQKGMKPLCMKPCRMPDTTVCSAHICDAFVKPSVTSCSVWERIYTCGSQVHACTCTIKAIQRVVCCELGQSAGTAAWGSTYTHLWMSGGGEGDVALPQTGGRGRVRKAAASEAAGGAAWGRGCKGSKHIGRAPSAGILCWHIAHQIAYIQLLETRGVRGRAGAGARSGPAKRRRQQNRGPRVRGGAPRRGGPAIFARGGRSVELLGLCRAGEGGGAAALLGHLLGQQVKVARA